MKVLIVDNYDSFTYNLFHYVQSCNVNVDVIRNDKLNFQEIEKYDKIIISPGPGLPSETKNMFQLLERYGRTKSILGVCLGMQGMAEYYGARLLNQEKVKHGVQEQIQIDVESVLFRKIPKTFKVGLYHSWKVDEETIPDSFTCTAMSQTGVVMAIQHKTLPLFGVQFHPESILTEHGEQLIYNFLNL